MPIKSESGSERYVNTALNWRSGANEAIWDARRAGVDKRTEYRTKGDKLLPAHERVQDAILEYRHQVWIYSDKLPEMWGHTIGQLSDGIEVTLANLKQLSDQGVLGPAKIPVPRNEIGRIATQEEVEGYRLLPLVLCESARAQLDACCREMGLMPQWEESYEDGHLQ